MYRKTTIKDPKMAQNEDCLISSAIVGLTFPDIIFPTLFSASKNCE